jgi:hypothetical protein
MENIEISKIFGFSQNAQYVAKAEKQGSITVSAI